MIALHQEIKKLGEKTDKQFVKVNLSIGELRLSVMKLDERVGKLDADLNEKIDDMRSDFNKYTVSNNALVNNHETRLQRLEEKPSGSSYIVSEPVAKYKRKKRK